MASVVSISNLAVASLGEKAFIQDIDEASVQARYCKLFYDQARRATLRAHPWNFASGRKVLAVLPDTVLPWGYTYALPTGCLKALRILPEYSSEKIPFELALSDDHTTRVIRTNAESATLLYTANVENPDLFDPLFVDAFAANLAWRLAPTIAPARTRDMAALFIQAMRAAQAVDAGEGHRDNDYEPDWLSVRVTGSTFDDYTRRAEDE